MSDLFSLEGRIALVTGSSRGLGLAMARALALQGASVLLNGRNQPSLVASQAALKSEGLTVETLPFDITDGAAVKSGMEAVVKRHGRLDILVNNAGIQHRAPLTDWQDEDWEQVMAANLSASFKLAREAARLMIPKAFGRIIATGSITGILARPTVHGYVAAKAGLHGLTRGLAAELGPAGITVNAIAPGYFATEMTSALVDDADFTAWVRHRTPLARWGKPEELGGAVVFLASPAGSYVNGHVLVVDGGMSVTL